MERPAARQNDRPSPQVTEEVAAKENLFGDASLSEEAGHEPCPARGRGSVDAPVTKVNTRTTTQSRKSDSRPPRPDRLPAGDRGLVCEWRTGLVVRRAPHSTAIVAATTSGADDDARLTSVAPERVSRPVKQGEYQDQSEQQAQPLGPATDALRTSQLVFTPLATEHWCGHRSLRQWSSCSSMPEERLP